MCVPLAQTALISSTTKSPLDGGLFWRSDHAYNYITSKRKRQALLRNITVSELCAAVIALELRFCRLAEQTEHETSERLLRQGYLFDIRGAADGTVGDVGLLGG